MSVLHNEIYEQPSAIKNAIEQNQVAIAALVAAIRRKEVRYVVLAARGTSDNAAIYAKYLFQIVCGIPVALAAPAVHTLFDAVVNYKDALVIGISQSGAGEDINEVVTQAKRSGALTAAITNTADSALAGIADHVLHCDAGVEKAVAATKTYTSTLAIIAALAAAWSGDSALGEKLARVDAVAQAALQVEERVRVLAQTLIHAERLLTVARGLHLATAIEAALKIAETTSSPTQSFSSADLLHGPIASVAVRTPCLLFLPRGETAQVMNQVGEKLQDRGARVLRFAFDAEPDSASCVPLTDPGTELLSPIVDILPAQLLAYHVTVARGLDPDNPLGLSKVTITR
ncbi:MAG: SIS domain-containing protein [Cytophagales bacterium]|nr:SIS domain-containing protein [Armatimonadota bacterium]